MEIEQRDMVRLLEVDLEIPHQEFIQRYQVKIILLVQMEVLQ